MKLTTASPKINDITTLIGVGTPLMPNKGAEITNEPTRTVARKNKGNKVIILVSSKPGNASIFLVKRSSSIIN